MRWQRLISVWILMTMGFAALGCGETIPLGNEPLTAEFTPDGSRHVYEFDLSEGEYAYLEVLQQGVDVAVALYDPNGDKQIQVDSPGGAYSMERIWFIADRPGKHRVEVFAPGSLGSQRYRIHLTKKRRPLSADDIARAKAAALSYHADLSRKKNSNPEALAGYTSAHEIWQKLGDTLQEAVTLY